MFPTEVKDKNSFSSLTFLNENSLGKISEKFLNCFFL